MPRSMSVSPSGFRTSLAADGALLVVAALLAGSFWIYQLPSLVQVGPLRALAPATVATLGLLAGLAIVCVCWTRGVEGERRPSTVTAKVAAGVLLAGLLGVIARTVSGWVTRLVTMGIDVNRADMLVQIQAALARLTAGENPYVVYQVPWELPLSYGPWLWGWFLVPHALNADLRLAPVVGEVAVAVLLAASAALAALGGRSLAASALAAVMLAFLGNPMVDQFLTIGHTPAYWPLIALFALAVAGGHYRTAGAVLGLLLGARTTMVALVPVVLIWLWRNQRRATLPAMAWMALTAGVSFAPFLVWDWRTLVYGMYGNYVRVIRDFVWAKTAWMDTTLGLTRVLLDAGWSGYVGLAQAGAMAAACALVWWRLRPGASPAPWLCLALAVFSMTTLWPVWYVFLDVFVLGLCLLAAEHAPALRAAPWRSMAAVTATAIAVVAATLLVNPGVAYAIEPGVTPRWHFRSGFGPDEIEGDRRYAWALRPAVHLRMPRGLRTAATIEIACEPFAPEGAPSQTLGVTLNGTPLGVVTLRPGWQTVRFPTRARAWRIGHNDVTLHFGYALTSGGEARAARVGRVAIAR